MTGVVFGRGAVTPKSPEKHRSMRRSSLLPGAHPRLADLSEERSRSKGLMHDALAGGFWWARGDHRRVDRCDGLIGSGAVSVVWFRRRRSIRAGGTYPQRACPCTAIEPIDAEGLNLAWRHQPRQPFAFSVTALPRFPFPLVRSVTTP